MKLYKLVDEDGFSRRGMPGETHWQPGEIVMPEGVYGGSPCGPGCLHFYHSPLEAALYKSIHIDYEQRRLLRCVTDDEVETDGLKAWTRSGVLVEKVVRPRSLELIEVVAWAILIAPHSLTEAWAVSWLSGKDRTAEAAAGADGGKRRVRELREYGCSIEVQTFLAPDGTASSTRLYRLSLPSLGGLVARWLKLLAQGTLLELLRELHRRGELGKPAEYITAAIQNQAGRGPTQKQTTAKLGSDASREQKFAAMSGGGA